MLAAEADADLRDAVAGLGTKPDGSDLGYKLRSLQRRVAGGRFLDHAGKGGAGVRWAAFPAKMFLSTRDDGGDEDDADGR